MFLPITSPHKCEPQGFFLCCLLYCNEIHTYKILLHHHHKCTGARHSMRILSDSSPSLDESLGWKCRRERFLYPEKSNYLVNTIKLIITHLCH